MPIANGIIYWKDTRTDFLDISAQSQMAHDSMASTFTESNILYSKSSVVEDIVLNKFLSIYNTAKSINFSNILRKNYVLESFTSQDYIDLKFPVDNRLNLDIQNGTLTLPVNNTKSLEADSIIIEAESNGQAGNAYAYDNSNADPKVILVQDNTTLFEYEKVSNIFSATTLYFSATIKLKAEEVANGCYIRLYSDNGNNYASVDSVDISLDGKEWVNVNKTIDINKADHYIRFMPKRIRFIRVRLKQDTYNVLKTAMGPKYRYVIGIREITAKQTSYKSSGEYVSIPFASRKLISGVAFNCDEVSFNDITYMVSANNGAKWVQIKNAETIDLNSVDMGMRGEIDINQIRVKVKMDRVRSPNAASIKEYIVTNTTDQYFMKYKPLSISAELGNHISYGTTKPYQFSVTSTAQVEQDALFPGVCIESATSITATIFYVPYTDTLLQDTEVRLNGALLKNDGTAYTFVRHSNQEHSIIVVSQSTLGSASSATMTLTYKPYLYDHRYSKVTGATISLPMNALVESQEGVNIEQISFTSQVLSASGEAANLFDNSISTIYDETSLSSTWDIQCEASTPFIVTKYDITPFSDPLKSPAKWTLSGSNSASGPWVKLDEQSVTDAFWLSNEPREFTIANNCAWAYYKFSFTEACDQGTILKMVNINMFASNVKVISDVKLYSIVPHTDTTTTAIKLSDVAYDPLCDYRITYLPSVSLASFMPQTWKDNGISMQSMHPAPIGSKIRFSYIYEDSETVRDIDFYTPVCHEYRVELL